VVDVGTGKRNQPAPPSVAFEALTQPDRPGGRPWLGLLDDEVRPQVIESDEPGLVVWSSIWSKRSDAVVRPFDLPSGGGGTDLGNYRRDQDGELRDGQPLTPGVYVIADTAPAITS